MAIDAPTGDPVGAATGGASVTGAPTARTPTAAVVHQTMQARRTGVGWPGVRPDASSVKRPRTATGAASRPPSGPPDPNAHRPSAQTVCAARRQMPWLVVSARPGPVGFTGRSRGNRCRMHRGAYLMPMSPSAGHWAMVPVRVRRPSCMRPHAPSTTSASTIPGAS